MDQNERAQPNQTMTDRPPTVVREFPVTSRNPADILWNQELLDHCLIAYGIKDPPRPPETSSQRSQSSQSSQAGAEKPEENYGGDESVETVETVERHNAGDGGVHTSGEEALKGAEVF